MIYYGLVSICDFLLSKSLYHLVLACPVKYVYVLVQGEDFHPAKNNPIRTNFKNLRHCRILWSEKIPKLSASPKKLILLNNPIQNLNNQKY